MVHVHWKKDVAIKNYNYLTIYSTYLVRSTPTLIKRCTCIANAMENKIFKVKNHMKQQITYTDWSITGVIP